MRVDLSIIRNSVNSVGNGLTIAGMAATVFDKLIPFNIAATVILVGIILIISSALVKEDKK